MFVLLTAAALLMTFVAVSVTTRNDVISTARSELQVGERLVGQVLSSRGAQLSDAAWVLANDFGFREAVATQDAPTIASALGNHISRIGADMAVVLNPGGDLVAAANGRPFRYPWRLAEGGDVSATVTVIDGAIYQTVIAPVQAPLHLAWVVFAFELDDEFADSIKRLTDLEFSLASPAVDSLVASSSLTEPMRQQLAAFGAGVLAEMGRVREVRAEDDVLLTLPFVLPGPDDDTSAHGLLQMSLDTALAPYRQLQMQLLVIAGVALLITLVGAVVVANGVAQPVRQLVAVAGRIARGDYATRAPVERQDELGKLAAAFNNMQEGIAERERRILFQAQHDALTNLPNRVLAHDRLSQAISRAHRTGGSTALLLLDINRFKEINDTLGHLVGDDVLCTLAARLSEGLRASDTVARLGGDEFLMLLADAGPEAAADKARTIAARLGETIPVQNSRLQIAVSIGVAACPAHGDDADMLLRRADIAMYAAKNNREPVAVYQDGYDEQYLHRLNLVADLKAGIERDEFFLEFQPKIDLATGEVRHAEALVRWKHPRLGRLAPDAFIPLAEQSGHIGLITQWVIGRTLDTLKGWLDKGADITVSLNLSAMDLLNADLPDVISDSLRARNIDPARLIAEVTESAVMRDVEFAIRMLHRLRERGIQLSIDDFGTGYSSLAQLKRLPVQNLKIDKSFVMAMTEGSSDAMIVKSTIELGHNMGLHVIAEGVETEEARSVLIGYHCDLAQGYLFSKPLGAEPFLAWYHARQRNAV